MGSSMDDIIDGREFELRSDFIPNPDLEIWNVENSHFKGIQKNLIGTGTKLIVGPRGTGKTHQMKWAYLSCLKNKSRPLPLYVSFSKYYHLEPFLSKAPNAIQIFHTWVLSKVLLSCFEYIKENDVGIILFEGDDQITEDALIDFTSLAEKGAIHIKSNNFISIVTIRKVISAIELLTEKSMRKRAILLMDDAALTLTPEYMIEFFDVLRSLKTYLISPKASVYPGTTEYGPRFHIGQDAQKVECWFNVEEEEYDLFVRELIEKRFKDNIQGIDDELIGLLKYASFGIPRAFISLLRNYIEDSGVTQQAKFNHIIDEQARVMKSEYLSIHKKLPQYKAIIETGFDFFLEIIRILKEENKALINEKQILIGIEKDGNYMYERMTQFLIEAGLLYEYKSVSHGDGRDYKVYIPHLLFLIQNKTFSSKSKGFNKTQILNALQFKDTKHPVRRKIQTILSQDKLKNLKLDLPPCKYCNSIRISQEQRFCHTCGKELVAQSAFESCMKIQINELSLTDKQKIKIISDTKFRTINDFMMIQDPAKELRKIYGIGPKTTTKILLEVRRIIDEFLI